MMRRSVSVKVYRRSSPASATISTGCGLVAGVGSLRKPTSLIKGLSGGPSWGNRLSLTCAKADNPQLNKRTMVRLTTHSMRLFMSSFLLKRHLLMMVMVCLVWSNPVFTQTTEMPYSETSTERWQSPVDRARLEIVYTFGYRGFESPPLRH